MTITPAERRRPGFLTGSPHGTRNERTFLDPAAPTVQIAPDLLAALLTTSAQAAASNVAEAQCAQTDVHLALKTGMADVIASILKADGGAIWASLYFRSFAVNLHKFEYATALEHISCEALMTFLASRLESDAAVPAGGWRDLRNKIFGVQP
ncbi:hypothetical protein ABH924_003292 [Arthrobacter sp. GAS37]|uniref:hypothetical protein n=1 Tax=Arthrobacter sp. GAS37 TaxID=3156261 RepID=UPI0038349464